MPGETCAAGRRTYAEFLAWLMQDGSMGKNKAYVSMSREWVLGSGAFTRELLQEHNLAARSRAWDESGAKELRESRWQEAMHRALAALRSARMVARARLGDLRWRAT